MSEPRVSVVVPSYNHAPWVGEAVASVLASPIAELELVIVDDGSTDGSLEVLERCRDDARLRLYPQQNQGAHAALNRGVALARGEVVFILNSDDVFAPERLPRFLERFDRDPQLALLSSWLEVIDGAGKSLGIKEGWRNMPPWPRPGPGPGLADTGDPLLALLETNYVSTTSNVAFRRQVFERGVRFQPLRYAHDWDFLLTAAAHGRFAVVEQPLVAYRVHPNNTIREGQHEARGRMRFEILWVVARHALRLCGDDPDLRRRMYSSLPHFGAPSLLAQLLVLRGSGETPPAVYDHLIDPEHPLCRAAVRALMAEDG